MNDNIVVVDNFFSDFHFIEPFFKNIKVYNLENFKKLQDEFKESGQKWPGERSFELSKSEPFLHALIIKEFIDKFNNFFKGNRFTCNSFMHLRLDKDCEDDWIHKDPVEYTLMVYLSKTNLNSGTIFYDEDNNPTQTINFVQNRAVIFPGHIRHKSMSNYGNDINDGRLTLNCFLDRV